jgi:hypothetical protein
LASADDDDSLAADSARQGRKGVCQADEVDRQLVETQPMDWQLAELNIARLRAPMDDPATKDFADGLDEINALADSSPGFVWRMQTEDGNATSIQAFEDELVITNMSVWESIEALGDYVYRSGHVSFLRRKREWFSKYGSAYMVLWWVPAGIRPTIGEALERLALLDREGPTRRAFTFGKPFPPPSVSSSAASFAVDDRNGCPA